MKLKKQKRMNVNSIKVLKKISVLFCLLCFMTVTGIMLADVNAGAELKNNNTESVKTFEPTQTTKPLVTGKPSVTAKPLVTASPSVEEKTLDEIYEEKGFLNESDLSKAVFEFEKEEYHVIDTDKISAKINCNIPEAVSRVEYNYANGMAEILNYSKTEKSVDIYGNYSGTTSVSMFMYVTYCDEDGMYAGEKKITASTTVEVLGIDDISFDVGDVYELKYLTYPEYSDWEYTFDNNNGIVTVENGYVKAVSEGYCTLYIENKQLQKRIYLAYISVYSNGICFENDIVNRAVGSMPYQLVLRNTNGKSVTWKSSTEAVAKVSSTGVVTPVSVGTATIYAEVSFSEKSVGTFSCTINVTNPVLDIEQKSNLAKGFEAVVNISGTTSKGVWKSSKEKVVSVFSNGTYTYGQQQQMESYNDAATIRANKKGSAVISVEIDGIVRSFTINVTNPKIKKNFLILTKGMKQYIKITGTNSDSVIKYISDDKKIATVNSKGLIKAKKIGYCPIYIEVDRATYIVDVNIGKKNAVKAVMNALKVEGAIYSQARRMQKGYYDCSSLVWRSYKPAGETFGSKYYAPVAANEALYCVNRKKTVPAKYINKLNKLRTGDVMFYKRDVNNGRYKKIYHVVIYLGQSTVMYGDYKYTYGKIIHANGSRVSQGSLYNHDNCVVIGRPFK